eukprot:647236-Rhodomonas_salina.1
MILQACVRRARGHEWTGRSRDDTARSQRARCLAHPTIGAATFASTRLNVDLEPSQRRGIAIGGPNLAEFR